MPQLDCLHTKHVKENVSLRDLSSFRVGGLARYFAEPRTEEELQDIIRCANQIALPFAIIGGCTNILFSDSGYPGVIIRYAANKITQAGTEVICGSGLGLQQLLSYCATNGLSGLEHLSGIPGLVGGAVRGNAGTSAEWINSAVVSIKALDVNTLQMRTLSNPECKFSYRNSLFKENPGYYITECRFALKKTFEKHVRSRGALYIKNRSAQPTGVNSAGCVFKNPPGLSAGKIIDQLGLKGKTMGGASVSEHHANFIINRGKASASDIIMLISYIKQQVRDKMGIQLQEEIEYIGF